MSTSSPAPRSDQRSRTSPSCSSWPASASGRARSLLASRTMQRPSAPSAASASTSLPPTNPVAPVTKARMSPGYGPGPRSAHAILRRVPLRTPTALMAASLVLLAGCGGCGNGGTSRSQPTAGAAGGDQGVRAARSARLKRIGSCSAPVYVTAPLADKHRLFVVEQAGRIRVVKDGHKLAKPFLDISSQVQSGGERGLLSMAFAPDYKRSGRFYIYFTDHGGDIHIQELKRASANRAARGSARNLLTIEHSEFGNHNGGQLQFGPDKRLYAGIGDGGSAGDPHNHGQSLATDLGKLLRIDPRKRSGGRSFGVKG